MRFPRGPPCRFLHKPKHNCHSCHRIEGVVGARIVLFASILVSCVALAATALLLIRARNHARQFVSFLAAALAAFGMISIVWTALPPVLLAAQCAAPLGD